MKMGSRCVFDTGNRVLTLFSKQRILIIIPYFVTELCYYVYTIYELSIVV
jgi:hypothetical protein